MTPANYMSAAQGVLPWTTEMVKAVKDYLDMRFKKDANFSLAAWQECLEELVSGLQLKKYAVQGRISKHNPHELSAQITYLFQVATNRRWNHVYFTPEQDASWNNISYYQDPYWHKAVNEPDTRAELEEILNAKGHRYVIDVYTESTDSPRVTV